MAQNMSDSQVLEYVKEGIRQGKEQKQLASELARKGVTKEQAMRVGHPSHMKCYPHVFQISPLPLLRHPHK